VRESVGDAHFVVGQRVRRATGETGVGAKVEVEVGAAESADGGGELLAGETVGDEGAALDALRSAGIDSSIIGIYFIVIIIIIVIIINSSNINIVYCTINTIYTIINVYIISISVASVVIVSIATYFISSIIDPHEPYIVVISIILACC
jgi:hypothetical protein